MGKSISLAIFFALILFIGDMGYNKAFASNGISQKVIKFHRIKEDNFNYYLYFKPTNKKTLDKYTLSKNDFKKIEFKQLNTTLGIVKITAKMDRKGNITNKRTSKILIALPKGQENSIATSNIKNNSSVKNKKNNNVSYTKKVNDNETHKFVQKSRSLNNDKPAKPSNSVKSGHVYLEVLELSVKKVFEDQHNFYLYGINSHNIKEPYVLSKNSFRVIREEPSANNLFNININASIDKNYNIIGEGSYISIQIPSEYNFRIPQTN